MQDSLTAAPAGRLLRQKIFEFIADKSKIGSALPTRKEVHTLFGTQCDDVELHLQALVREGLVILDKDGSGDISLVPTFTPAPQIEQLGRVARQLTEHGTGAFSGSIGLDLRGIGVPLEPGMSMVQVFDDRMSDAGIRYGDIALLINTTPMRGDIVALEEGDVMVLRRYLVVSGIPHFLAENSSCPQLKPAWETPMHGVLWGLIRIAPCQTAQPAQTIKTGFGSLGQPRAVLSQDADHSLPKKGKKAPRSAQTDRSKQWPQLPSGIQLNEPSGGYRCTETPTSYATWEPCHPEIK